jgi:eukaryotic-like serine/threonine-protein kinase
MTSLPTLKLMARGRIPVNIGEVEEVELLELLGKGTFGQVWKVVDCRTGKTYSLKLIQYLVPGSIMTERVRLEAEVKIPSQYIVPAIGLREWDPSTFLILFEYYEAQPLNQLLKAGALTPEGKRQVFAQTLRGVGAAHRSNIIHRDLKPANILVSPEHEVRLIDFGISKFRGKGLTTIGDLMGTPQYLAPEALIEGSAIADARTDIFALGQILYELEMGQHFWQRQGWTELEDFYRFIKQTPPPTEAIDLKDFVWSCYPDSQATIAQMLKIDPAERLAAVEGVLARLGYPAEKELAQTDLQPVFNPSLTRLELPLLIVESGSNRGAKTVLNIPEGGTLTLGRVDIAGSDDSISRCHLEFSRVGQQYCLRDLGSKNGTLLRGNQLRPGGDFASLQHQDRIKVGDVFLRIEFQEIHAG